MINYIQNRGSAVLKNRVIYRSFRTGVQIVSPSQKNPECFCIRDFLLILSICFSNFCCLSWIWIMNTQGYIGQEMHFHMLFNHPIQDNPVSIPRVPTFDSVFVHDVFADACGWD